MACRILLADDSPFILDSVRLFLEHAGFEVVGQAATGTEAVRLAGMLAPDVAILDLCMPDLDGLGAACVIRHERPETRIILFTGYSDKSTILRALQLGIEGYVTKTELVEALIPAIRAVARGGTYLSSVAAREHAA
jgi:DNA-binding NarL/FixJ family response regulator